MAIKINLESTKIPVEIGDLKFEFDASDKNRKYLEKKAKEIGKKEERLTSLDFEKLTDEESEKAEMEANDLIKESFNYILGEGAFEKIYEQTPSIIFLTDYLVQLINGIENVMNEKTKNTKKEFFRNKKTKR